MTCGRVVKRERVIDRSGPIIVTREHIRRCRRTATEGPWCWQHQPSTYDVSGTREHDASRFQMRRAA